MAIELKYRLHEAAKDFDKSSKLVTDILTKEFPGEEFKAMTVLTDDQLNFLFETITQKDALPDLNAYFATSELRPKKTAAPEKKPADQKKPAEKPADARPAAAKPAQAPVKEQVTAQHHENTAAKTVKAPAPAQGGAVNRNKNNNNNNNNNSNRNKPNAAQTDNRPASAPNLHPFQKHRREGNAPVNQPSKTKGETKVVDTRTNQVDLDKYNEHYEQIAPVNGRVSDRPNKQKLKQRSQQYRRQGMHGGKRETESERLRRIAAERAKKTIIVQLPEQITVGELAEMLHMTSAEVIKKLFALGVMATVNEVIDYDTASIVCSELGAKAEKQVVVTIEDRIIDDSEDKDEDLQPRDPVVCVMGHVDHGKTSLLDAIRHTAVTDTEAGGITQAIGAYRVDIGGKKITFLDTPGHAAFTAMRARGAQSTDIAVLVVAADDGIMPQTIEAINHAKAADVPIIVAVNKMDKPGASPDKVLQQLTEYELVPEEWGGDTIVVPVSAKTKLNIDKLLQSILLIAEMKELRANPNRAAKGVVIEARLDKGKGPIATLLVQNGTLHTGDIIVAGSAVGKVRVMNNDRHHAVKKAGPAVPVEIMGLAEVPQAGDIFNAVSDEKLARQLVEQRKQETKEEEFKTYQKVTLDTLFDSIEQGEMKELDVVVKADVQGSVEAVKQNLEKLTNDEVRVRVIHGGVGGITESDVMLADASNAIIVGFNVRPDPVAVALAERSGVEIRTYRVIYDCIEEIEAAIKGMLAPKFRDVDIGRAEVRSVFKISSAGTIAGSYVLDGKVTRASKIRVVRDGVVVAEDEIASLKRFKDDAKEVASGYECGIGLERFNDIKEGDIFEAYVTQEYQED
jgi:translation initiation factor IF-2